MAVYRRSGRRRFTLLVIVLACLTLLTLDNRANGGGIIHSARGGLRDALAPLQRGVDVAVQPVADLADGLVHRRDLQAENKRLRAENDRLRGQALAGADAQRDRDALRALLKLDFAANIPAVAARVVNRSPSNFAHTLEVDRGTDDGVGKGMPVVVTTGLVGRVTDATKHTATVLLVNDPNFNVSVRFADPNGDVGNAQGTGTKDLRVDYVDRLAKLAPGMVAQTSGLKGAVFPAGIPVAAVTKVGSRPGAYHLDVTATPTVDLSRLDYVQVLVWGPR